MRQIIAAISSRRQQQFKVKRVMLEWQTRVLATYIGATAWAGAKDLVDSAAKLSMVPHRSKEEQEAVADNPNEPKRGSFERFGMLMGRAVMPARPPEETREDVHEHGGPEAGRPD